MPPLSRKRVSASQASGRGGDPVMDDAPYIAEHDVVAGASAAK